MAAAARVGQSGKPYMILRYITLKSEKALGVNEMIN